MYKILFNRVKKIIPKISETEIIALKSGGVSIDREIFQGKVNYKKLYNDRYLYKPDIKESIFVNCYLYVYLIIDDNNNNNNNNNHYYYYYFSRIVAISSISY
jgi:hypothetical protein